MSDFEFIDNRWLLPAGIEEILPEQAHKLEQIRRQLLDCYRNWGYEFVIPPMMEYVESLQTGTGQDLDLQTLKVIDSQNGRMMGLRADITPQVARIDAHLLNSDVPARLCYFGTVLLAYAETMGGSRSPLQIGAELFGHAGIESVIEIVELMLETMTLLGIEDFYLDLGHIGIFKALAHQAQLDDSRQAALFDALQRKAVPDINDLLDEWGIDKSLRAQLTALANLNGGAEVLAQAQSLFLHADETIKRALTELEQISSKINQHRPEVSIHFDLSELRGFNYHSGVVFAIYIPSHGQEIARGGRYDGIGEVFGRARSATGFSADLKMLLEISGAQRLGVAPQKLIFAPCNYSQGKKNQGQDDLALQNAIKALREAGERVVCQLPDQSGDAAAMGCTHQLLLQNGNWNIQPIDKKNLK